MADKTITAVVGATGTQVENHSAEDKRIVDRVLKYNSRGAGLTVWEFTFGTGVPPHDSILVGTPPRWIVFGRLRRNTPEGRGSMSPILTILRMRGRHADRNASSQTEAVRGCGRLRTS